MASSSPFDVVDILDDDDDGGGDAAAAVASPPSSRKRSLAAATSSADFLDGFSPSPPAPKRGLLATAPIDVDDTPPPPKRLLPSSASRPPVIAVLDDDDGTGPSAAPCSLVPGDDVADTPDSVLLGAGFSETPGSAEPRSTGSDVVVPETPLFASPPSVGPPAAHGLLSAAPLQKSTSFTSPRLLEPPAAHGWSSAAPVQKPSGVPSPISLDSDDELDFTVQREPLTNLPNNKTKADPVVGCAISFCFDRVDSGPSNDQRECLKPSTGCYPTISASIPKVAKQKKVEDDQLIEERKKKQQKEKRLKEEKAKQIQERKQKQEENKMKKQAMKAELALKKKKEKEIRKWESGKLALKYITVQIHPDVLESCTIGGRLLQSLAEKPLSYKLIKNRISRSILWKMDIPDDIAQALSGLDDGRDMNQAPLSQVPYILIVLQAEEFCDLVSSGTFFDHVQNVRSLYPTFTICYAINRLLSYISKSDQTQYANSSNSTAWRRPPVEKVLCKLATHYNNVHSRQCIDDAEVAEHVVGLTCSLAKCKFRKPLTWLTVHANGSIIPKNFVDKDLAKKDTWLKSLIAIPKVSPKQAHAIWKRYRSMRSLLNVYMDPSKTDREKELLLSDLRTENQLGDEGRRVGEQCSARVYRILMAQDGKMETDAAVAGDRC